MCTIKKIGVLAYTVDAHGKALVGNGFVLLMPDGTYSVYVKDLNGNDLPHQEYRIETQDEIETYPYPSYVGISSRLM